jgi:signal transduction histidine kinase
MWFGIQIAAYTSLIVGYALLLVLAVRHRTGQGRAQKLLEGTLFLAGLWTSALGLMALLVPDGWWAFLWQRTAQIGLVVLALLTADFADAFVERLGHRWPRWSVAGLLALIAVALDARPFPWLVGTQSLLSIQVGPSELSTLFLIAAWAVPTASAWWTSAWALRRATGSKHRNRVRYLRAALLAFLVGDLLVLVGLIPGLYVGLAARLFGFTLVALAILHYDLPDLRRLGLMVLRVTLMAGLTAALYLFFLLAAGALSGAWSGIPRSPVAVPALIVAMLIAAAIDVSLAPRLHRFFDRTVLGQNYNIQKALRTYSRQISLIIDLERLADTTLDWLRTALRVERSAFVLYAAQSDGRVELEVLRAIPFPPSPAQTFAADSRFVLHFRNLGQPLSQYDLDMLTWFQAMRSEERQWLKQLAVDLYIPVLVAEKPVALLALGPKADGQPYFDEDLEALILLAGQTGTAVENARLMDDLRGVQAELHRLNTELAETNRQLQRLDQAKSDFVTIASHELRTPLSQIFGYSDVLASLEGEELGDAEVVEQFIDGIARGARRLKRVVDAMVDISLIESGALKMYMTTVAPGEVIERVVELVQSGAGERDVIITVRDLSRLPNVRADEARLEQAFVSLVGNAVKFTPDGKEIVIWGRFVPSSSDGPCVEMAIADQGIGIDPDEMALIFEKFYRPENPLLHSSNDSGFKGAGPGLGLAIARGIVEAHGGRVWAESPGRDEESCPGSTFHVRLPVAGAATE